MYKRDSLRPNRTRGLVLCDNYLFCLRIFIKITISFIKNLASATKFLLPLDRAPKTSRFVPVEGELRSVSGT